MNVNGTPTAGELRTEEYLPGAFSGAASGYGLANDLSYDRPAAKKKLLRSQHLAGSLQ
jgi:hypothetical protein